MELYLNEGNTIDWRNAEKKRKRVESGIRERGNREGRLLSADSPSEADADWPITFLITVSGYEPLSRWRGVRN